MAFEVGKIGTRVIRPCRKQGGKVKPRDFGPVHNPHAPVSHSGRSKLGPIVPLPLPVAAYIAIPTPAPAPAATETAAATPARAATPTPASAPAPVSRPLDISISAPAPAEVPTPISPIARVVTISVGVVPIPAVPAVPTASAVATVSRLVARKRRNGRTRRRTRRFSTALPVTNKPAARALLLLPPVAALLVVLADLEGVAQPLALADLCVGHLVDLVHLERLARGRAACPRGPLHIGQELLAQLVAAGIDLVFVDAIALQKLVSEMVLREGK